MAPSISQCLRKAVVLGLLSAEAVSAHSWVEQIMNIAANGTMVGNPGYIRGFAGRGAGFNDDQDTYLLPPNGRSDGKVIHDTDALCHPSQTLGNYSSQFPKLTTSPGSFLALRYQENGHVTLPDVNPTKPLNRGTVYIYGTTQPAADEKFADVFNAWTEDGTGGNGRGRLLATRNFDDGQCYQVNGNQISTQRQAQFKKVAANPQGADLWCQNDLQLPANLSAGADYTLYWVWSWPTMNKAGSPNGIPDGNFNITTEQYYTSCMEVSVTNGGSAANSKASIAFAQGQDLNNAAIQSQLTGGNFQVDPNGGSSGSSGSSGSTSTAAAAAPTTSSAKANAPATAVTTVVTTTTTTATVTVSSASAAKAAAVSNANAGEKQTIIVTVTATQSPQFVTVTKTVGNTAAASGAASATAPTSVQDEASTVTTFRTTTVAAPRTTPNNGFNSTVSSNIVMSAQLTSGTAVVPSGIAPSVSPFTSRLPSRPRRRL